RAEGRAASVGREQPLIHGASDQKSPAPAGLSVFGPVLSREVLLFIVMPGLDPGIQRCRCRSGWPLDRRVKPGDDNEKKSAGSRKRPARIIRAGGSWQVGQG